MFVRKDENERKRGRRWPIFYKKWFATDYESLWSSSSAGPFNFFKILNVHFIAELARRFSKGCAAASSQRPHRRRHFEQRRRRRRRRVNDVIEPTHVDTSGEDASASSKKELETYKVVSVKEHSLYGEGSLYDCSPVWLVWKEINGVQRSS